MGDDDFRIPLVAKFAVTLFAAGYLIATRRRSRRAALVGLCGVWLFGLWWLRVATGFHYVTLFRAVGLDKSLYRPGLVWIQFIHLAPIKAAPFCQPC